MKINVNKLEYFQENKVKFISNLPYYLSTQILLKVLPFHPNVSEASFMFQKEVAERLIANPHTKKYSKLSVIIQYCCNIKKIFNLKSNIFYPKPDVDSCLLNFKPKKNVSIDVFNELKKITKFAFEIRRKTVKNSSSNIEGINELFKKLEIDEKCRAENLSVEKYINLAKNLIKKS
jgi:16S rRNA (adenine1518-N6/adenine1519-N6)-dimethyltransferase